VCPRSLKLRMQYTRDFPRDDCARNMSEEKSTTRQGFNLRRNFAFACTPSLSSRVITWLEPAIQSKTQCLVSGQLKKPATSMSFWPELVIKSRDTGQRIPSFDSYQLIITWMSNIKDVLCATLLFFKKWGLAYRRTDSHVTTKIFEIDWLPSYWYHYVITVN